MSPMIECNELGIKMDMEAELLIDNLYNAFDPFEPLPAGNPNYVDCREVRGEEDILVDLGQRIRRSHRNTCYLYSGHRGSGKSTELLRLKEYLEGHKFYVVYFAADQEDIQSEDVQYTDILLACTRHILQDLQNSANPNKLLTWFKTRLQELIELGLTDITLEGLNVEGQIAEFTKLTANLRAEPTLRQKIRDKVDLHTQTLIDILNDFLREAKRKLPDDYQQLVVIVDNLDRIVPIVQESGRTNHEEIFLDRSGQLKALDCHLIYTVPISLIYSDRSTDLMDIYGHILVLPMIMVRHRGGEIYEKGFNKVKDIIAKRVSQFAPNLALDSEIFESEDVLNRLCLVSGGHIRNLLFLMQEVIGYIEKLPISERNVRIASSKVREVFRRAVESHQWKLLAEVAQSKRIVNAEEYRELLFSRCILEYCYRDERGDVQRWHDVHPLIKDIDEFKEQYGTNNRP